MKKIRLVITLIVMCVCCSSCSNNCNLTTEQISKYSSGVVLIENIFYYKIQFNNGGSMYLKASAIDENNNVDISSLSNNEEDMLQGDDISAVFGTGFFVSKDGKIATNLHVVDPSIETDKNKVTSILNNELYNWKIYYEQQITIMTEQLAYTQDEIEIQDLENKIELAKQYCSALNVGFKPGGIEVVSNIIIYLNDTHEEYKDCIVISKSTDPIKDVALIQLKDKQTPVNAHVFQFADNISNQNYIKSLKVGKKLFMIGYNHGPDIAITKQGIEAQTTEGAITQSCDGNRVLYSIPTISGASGSPVLNSCGKVVAVNYASVRGTQSFNYGIPANYLKKLIDESN
jgi:S1-C subfamily serine protease